MMIKKHVYLCLVYQELGYFAKMNHEMRCQALAIWWNWRRKLVDIWELRKQIGTSPSENVKEETKFYRGVEDIQTSLVDFPSNPYKALFTMVTSTWGNVWCTDKWQ